MMISERTVGGGLSIRLQSSRKGRSSICSLPFLYITVNLSASLSCASMTARKLYTVKMNSFVSD